MKEEGRSKHSTSRRLFNSSKEKKRRRAVASDSDSSDYSSEPIRQKVDKFHNGSAGCKGDYVEDGELTTEKRESNGLDVFEFDEYDGFDDSMIRKNASNSKHRSNLNNTPTPTNGTTSRLEIEDDESDLPLAVLTQKYRSSSNKSSRLQGKNGVLKVMVNKNKQTSVSRKTYDSSEAEEDPKEPTPRALHKKKVHVSEDSNKNKSGIKSSLNSNSKPAVSKKSKEPLKSNSEVEVAKSESSDKTPVKEVTQVKGKEIKVNRGSNIEKQELREKIKEMILDAGWTIDFRPRRGRNYNDSIYISPSGTAYWSIVKAYDALKKEEEDNSKDGGNFTPLPDEILGKLTRQTRKKIEREMKNKRKGEESDQKEEKPKRRRKAKKYKFDDESEESGDESSENSDDEKSEKTMSDTNSNEGKSKKIGRCTLLVRGSDTGVNSENDKFVAYSGKRTLLSWLIDSGVVNVSENVEYMNSRKTRGMQKGSITKDGIRCGCCSKIVTVSKFEEHSGSKLQQPFLNIFLQSGKSLMQCMIDAWNKQGELERKGFYNVDDDGDDPNDDTCGLCGDGGDLICCDSCPSTFHQSCLEIQMLPQGDWHCPNCTCKYCEVAGGETDDSILTCCLCQKKYHESCRPEKEVKPTESDYMNLSFCGNKCHELYIQLQKLFGVKHELDSEFSWTLIHRSDLSTDASSLELSQKVESNSMLAVAMSIMEECFLSVTDRKTGANLIRNVVFNCGSNLSRLNYSSFFTAILEKGDEVVVAASIRIHGTQLAEMPFIGTRHMYRRQGMCRRLLSAIESALSSLEVEKLIIPAVAERMHTWTDVFGFKALEESHKQEMKSMNMLVFPKTDMLQKPLVKKGTPNVIPKGEKSVEVDDHKPLSTKPELVSSDVKEVSEKTESGCEESIVRLDDTCSVDANKETRSINSPVKDDVAVSENKSDLVSNSSGGIEDPITKTADADSHDNNNIVSSESPHESKVEDSVVQITPKTTSTDIVSSDVPCEPKLQLPETESVSALSHSDSHIEEKEKEQEKEKEIGVQNGDDNPSHDNTVPSVEEIVTETKIDIHVTNGYETTNNTTDVNSLELEATTDNIVSSDTHCDHESADVTTVILETEELDVKDDNIQVSGGKEASCENETQTESNAQENEIAVSDSDALKS